MTTRPDDERYRSPLEELKDLLRRTSQVEKSLCQIEASEDSCRSPEARGQQEGQRAERPKLGTGPDNDRQGAGDGIGRTEDGDIRIGRTWGEERYPQTEAVASQKILGHAQCPARSTVSRHRARPGPEVEPSRRQDIHTKPLTTGKSIPRTPLAVTMAKHQQAEAEFLKERVQLKREVDQQRKRASGLEHRYSQLQALYKHQGAELKSLKTALEQRDAQLEEYQTQLRQEHEEASRSVSSFQAQIASLKGERNELQQLLSAALHQLQEGRPSLDGSCKEHAQASESEEIRGLLEKVEKQLQDALGRLEWQNETVDHLLQTQLKHNRSKANSIAVLLKETASTDAT